MIGGIDIKNIKFQTEFERNGNKWNLTVFDDNTAILRTYDKKYKWWVTVYTINKYNKEAEKFVTRILGKQYINQVLDIACNL